MLTRKTLDAANIKKNLAFNLSCMFTLKANVCHESKAYPLAQVL